MKKSAQFIALLLCVVCFLAGLYTGQHLEQNKLLAILEADAKAWERSQYEARLRTEKEASDLFEALSAYENRGTSPSQTPEQTASTLNLLAAAVNMSTPKPTATPTPKPTAKPTIRPTVTPMPTVVAAEVQQQYESARASWSTTPKPTATISTYDIRAERAKTKTAVYTAQGNAASSTKITAWVTGDSANVRRGSSTSYGVVEKLYYGEKLYIIDKTALNGWYRVQTQSGNTGYVSAKLISTSQPTTRNSSGGSGSSGNSSQQSRTVYVSRTGECYHSYAGCSDMNNPIAMTEAEAIARGRRRCRKCW